MDFNQILTTISHISPISQEAWADFKTLLAPVSLNKNDFLVKEGSKA